MSDSTRNHLVSKFACMACGELLKLSYEKPPSSHRTEVENITGVDKVVVTIGVHPCNCSLIYKRDLEALRNILNGGNKTK